MKTSLRILASIIALATLILVITLQSAQAQCGDGIGPSSCFTCHEKEAADPVYGTGIWHDVHAFKDCCWNCHGGNARTADKFLAHEGMSVQPLDDVYSDCYACHPLDYQQRADLFGAILGVTPASRPTSTPVPINTSPERPIGVSYQIPRQQTHDPAWISLGSGILIMGTFLLLLLFLSRAAGTNKNTNHFIQNS